MRNRVLAAEDSPTQAVLLRSCLEGAGFEVTMAANGVEALKILSRGAFDIVVSDVIMPELDGYGLCRAVKDLDPHLPVVLLTSLTDPLDVVRALSAGADNFLRKPYQADELVQRVRNMVHNKELRDTGRAQMGLELFFLGRRFMINAEREQILDLLVSTFEDLVGTNQALQAREDELARAHEELTVRLAETELERKRLNAVLAALPDGMVVVDDKGVIVDANQNLADLVGVPVSSLRGEVVWDAIPLVDHAGNRIEAQKRGIAQCLRGEAALPMGTTFDVFVERPDGSRFAALARSAPIVTAGGAPIGAVGVLEDIGPLLAHDPVTGLAGHGILLDRLRKAAEDAAPNDRTGLVVVTVDRYDRMRESLPSGGCDRVVTSVVARLREALGRDDVRLRSATPSAAYLGNGEIAVIVPGIEDEADAVVIGELLADRLRCSVDVDEVKLAVTVSVAVGMADHHADPAQLVSAVAAAARRLSAAGGDGVVASDPSMHADVVQRLKRENELRAAIAGDGLVVHYQPKVELRHGRPVAVEALVRWQHPEHGLLGAADIIPLAVESGLIAPLGWRVLEQACAQAAEWHRSLAGSALLLSVNVAAEQLCQADVAARVERILADTGFDPAALILEITEGSVMEGTSAIGERLNAIKALGVRLAIDDFGTGYSSLLQLRQLPVDILKIDRTFVAGMVDGHDDAAIVTGSVGLARALGLQVIAEGVENAEQLLELQALGCDMAQGYHWARPLPAEELARWWTERPPADPAWYIGGAPRTYGRRAGDGRQHVGGEPLLHELAAALDQLQASPREAGRVDEAIHVFVDHATSYLGQLGAQQPSADDPAVLTGAAHALGGANFGAQVLADLSNELAHLAHHNALPAAPLLVERVRSVLREAADALGTDGPAQV